MEKYYKRLVFGFRVSDNSLVLSRSNYHNYYVKETSKNEE